MSLRRRLALATVALAACAGATSAAPALAHEGNPDFESLVTSVDGIPGLKAEILNGDDRLLFVYEGAQPLVVEGYDEEPYARIDPDGTVSVNQRSEATYINDDRFGEVPVPDTVDKDAAPVWKVVGKGGRFEFHDHRMHWMSRTDPPLKQDRGERQKVFDWSVPVRLGDAETASASVRGTLWWRGEGGGAPVAMFAALGVFVVVAVAFVVVVRRRRAGAGGDGGAAPAASAPAGREAW